MTKEELVKRLASVRLTISRRLHEDERVFLDNILKKDQLIRHSDKEIEAFADRQHSYVGKLRCLDRLIGNLLHGVDYQ